MKILIAAGSFKDVFTSIEACNMIKTILPSGNTVKCIPVCDGGENTLAILEKYFLDCGDKKNEKINAQKITVCDVVGPYGGKKSADYLVAEDKAYIVSAEILHLSPDEDRYKNPCYLTDYGLGQLIADAIKRGFKDIQLCLGGTSTIGYGIGTAQALGAEVFGETGDLFTDPVTPHDYCRISRICFHPERYRNIRLSVINDGITKASDLYTVNPLKIGDTFANERDAILKDIDISCRHIYELTGLSPDDPWSGNGGGIYYGIEPMFSTEYFKGADFFCNRFRIEEAMERADIVITGEGRFDNPHLEKIPIVVSKLARKHNCRVLFLCGQIAPEWAEKCENVSEGIYNSNELKKQYGIDRILSCTEFYESNEIEQSSKVYREYTPVILKERLQSCQTCFQ